MVYLENATGTKFWSCRIHGMNVVKTRHGKIGNAGRTTTKQFDTTRDAQAFLLAEAIEKREKENYKYVIIKRKTPAKPTATTTATKTNAKAIKRTAIQKKRTVAKKTKKTTTTKNNTKNNNIKINNVIVSDRDTKIDVGIQNYGKDFASRVELHPTLHAKLALVDLATNSDQYFIMQVLIEEGKKEWHLYTRRGRTGTSGQTYLISPFMSEADCRKRFEKEFEDKTGISWNGAVPGVEPQYGKHEYLATMENIQNKENMIGENGTWYYYLKNDPLGKVNGWYEYDKANSFEVEETFGTYMATEKAERLQQRIITSESSGFQYRVDLKAMKQTNVSSGTTRPIARTENGNPPTKIPK